MVTHESDPPPDLPPCERSAYECCLDCYFQALHSLNIDVLVQMLQKHQDYMGFIVKIELLSDEGKELLISTPLWNSFAKKAVVSIQCCLMKEKDELGKMKKQLVLMERLVIRVFATANAPRISSEEWVKSNCQALLNVLASLFMSLLKHDMCQGITSQNATVSDVVDKAFSLTDTAIKECFVSVGNQREAKSLMECLYYVVG